MSLIVRLPLNNDLTNFGCDEITTSGAPTFVQNISKMSKGSLYTNTEELLRLLMVHEMTTSYKTT